MITKTTSLKGFYKVAESGGSYVCGTFYNPDTNEYFHTLMRDYDYDDGCRDNDELYYMPIHTDVKNVWLHHCGIITIGDTVEVVKGRKMVGEQKVVKGFRTFHGKYGLEVEYVVFTDGTSVMLSNCSMVDKWPKPIEVQYLDVMKRA